MRLRFVGTGAAVPSARRGHVSFVLWAGRPLLVECGPTVPWQLLRLGIDHRDIADVFISHAHGDHSLGLPMLLTQGKLDGREWPLRVYCPASAVERLKAAATACYPSLGELMEQEIQWIGLSESARSQRLLDGGIGFSAAPGQHSVPQTAIRFDFDGKSVVYSGDTGPCPSIRDLARDADLLLHEATWSESIDGRTSPDHTSARQAGRLADEAGVRRLALVHLHKDYLGREAELRAEAAESFEGEILVPEDGDEVEV
jgi:ribonuclease Z